jgi:hypothetical protein
MKYAIVTILLIIPFSGFAVFALADTFVLQPGPMGKDACANGMYPTWNMGNEVYAYINHMMWEHRFLIEWDISGLPEGAEIDNAAMEIYCYNFYGEEVGSIAFHRITETWEEGTVNWENQPNYDFTDLTIGDWPEVGEWAYFDVTDQVIAWYEEEHPNCGVIGIGTENGCGAAFWSSDYDDEKELRPKLTVEYTPADAAVTPSSLGAVKAAYR